MSMKDWKGNKNSLRAAIAVKSKKSTNERQEDDFYATDPEALQKLLDSCSRWLFDEFDKIKPSVGKIQDKIHLVMPIWECACGNGNLAEVLLNNGFIVWATDLKDRGYGQNRNIDFLGVTKTGWMYFIISNENGFAIQIIDSNGQHVLKRQFKVDHKDTLFYSINLSDEGIISALLARKENARIVWWRTDSLIASILK